MPYCRIRCPVCDRLTVSMKYIFNGTTRKTIQSKANICTVCDLIIPLDDKTGFWNGSTVVRKSEVLTL